MKITGKTPYSSDFLTFEHSVQSTARHALAQSGDATPSGLARGLERLKPSPAVLVSPRTEGQRNVST